MMKEREHGAGVLRCHGDSSEQPGIGLSTTTQCSTMAETQRAARECLLVQSDVSDVPPRLHDLHNGIIADRQTSVTSA